MLKKFKALIKDERGDMGSLVWTLGIGLLAALIIAGLVVFAPGQVQTFFTNVIGWISSKFQTILQ